MKFFYPRKLVSTPSILLSSLLIVLLSLSASAQVTFEKEVKISDKGLFFDGSKVGKTAPNNGSKYDYIFGNRITPHGDCIKEFNGFVFMTWYRGGKTDRHVMLSRYNPNTGVVKTIEFPHRHTGFQNQLWLGESHNTIAVGICPIDGTIHLLYDMHSYSENRPDDGSLKNDYFRYSFSKKNAATVPDNQFTLSQFVKDGDGDYKHLKMRNGTDYRSLTYPNFFVNQKGELFMWIREGGNNNGAYKFCKYDGNSWSDFTQFNVLNAKSRPGISHNWGLYGDIKFSGGKMRIGFATRYSNNNDKYVYNNGIHYAYSDDPNGLNQWKDHTGKSLTIPVFDPGAIKIFEPGNLVPSSGKNSVTINSGVDWISTSSDDLHFVTRVKGSSGGWVNVHTYKKAGTNDIKHSTNFPGGNLYAFQNDVYLIGLSSGRIFVEKAPGGTNNWTRIYQSPNTGKKFRHGNVYISEEGKVHFYLMENKSGSAQPIYLQILDLGLDIDQNKAPLVNLTSPADNATYELGDEISLAATASDSDGSVAKVNFKINDSFFKLDTEAPYAQTFTPTEPGTYKIAARAFDNEDAQTEDFVTITVLGPNQAPQGYFSLPSSNELMEGYSALHVQVEATDPDGEVSSVLLQINGQDIRSESVPPYDWGHSGSPNSSETTGLTLGEHTFSAVITDDRGATTTISKTIIVVRENEAPQIKIISPSDNDLFYVGDEVIITAVATDDKGVTKVNFKVNGSFFAQDDEGTNGSYSRTFIPDTPGTYTLGARAFDEEEDATEVTVDIVVEERLITSTQAVSTSELKVFPNPSTSGIFHLSGTHTFEVYGIDGVKVLDGSGVEVDLSSFEPGVYLLVIDETKVKLLR